MVAGRDPEQVEQAVAAARSMQLEIDSDPQAPGVARSAAKGFYEGLADELCATLILLVSELVSNAVIHSDAPAGMPIVLSLRRDGGYARVDVADSGSSFFGLGDAHGGAADLAEASGGGYGLAMVDKASSHWGIDRGAGTHVWFDMAC